jgi:hypothetical protein
MKKLLLLFVLAVTLIFILSGCSPSKNQLSKEYRKGYLAGRKAEQSKWSDKRLQLAKRIISDQIESQSNIERLVKGDIRNLKVGYVENKGPNKAYVWMEAEYKGKTSVAGYFEFKKVDDYWFLITTRKTAEEVPNQVNIKKR